MLTNRDLKFTAAVLAGGRSTRMGADKAFLRLDGKSLIERQLRLLREAGASELLISGRNGVDYSAFSTTVVFDAHPDAGPLAGVASVLKAATLELVLVLAVDMPAMSPPMLHKIIASCSADCGAVPFHGEGFEPLAAAYPKRALALAECHLRQSQLSMRGFVQAAIAQGFVTALPLDSTEKGFLANWNRPEDWNPSITG